MTWGSVGIVPKFLTSETDGGEWSASHPGHFNRREIGPRYPLDRTLGEPQKRSGGCGEEKNVAPAGNRTRAVQPIAIPSPHIGSNSSGKSCVCLKETFI
jgi:hypothetical protein